MNKSPNGIIEPLTLVRLLFKSIETLGLLLSIIHGRLHIQLEKMFAQWKALSLPLSNQRSN